MLGWFRALMPKEDKFFDLFDRHSRVLVAGAEALRHLLEGGEAVPRHCRTIVDREHDADAIAREVLLAVRRSFITPFDRSDITDLIQSMDDSIDQMHQTAKTVTLFELRSFEPAMRDMGEIIVQAANLTASAVPMLRSIGRHAGALNAYAEEIVELEGRADDLHDGGLRSLYVMHRHGNAIEYVVGSEVYGCLERVVDSFEDVANEISSLVIEHL
jgi:predicted phosphate transport protein (TIGR00153 family)